MKFITKNDINKINLGCGLKYLPAYLNIDNSRDVVSDINLSVSNLDSLPKGYFQLILVEHVIEHLGYCGFYTLLADIYLLLKNSGVLEIETPDIEKSFNQYLSAKTKEEKENILCWIYGIEDPGMGHIFCFPEELLNKMLLDSGFVVEKLVRLEEVLFRPGIRITARRVPGLNDRNELISCLNKKLKIRYDDFQYFENIIRDVSSSTNRNDFVRAIQGHELIAPKVCRFIAKRYQRIHKEWDLIALLKRLDWLKQLDMFKIAESMDYQEALDLIRKMETSGKPHPKQGKNSISFDFFTDVNLKRYVALQNNAALKKEKLKKGTKRWG